MDRRRVYQIAAGYEDRNDADLLGIDPALRLAIGKDNGAGAGQSRLSRLENEVLGTEEGLKVLENGLTRSNYAKLFLGEGQAILVDEGAEGEVRSRSGKRRHFHQQYSGFAILLPPERPSRDFFGVWGIVARPDSGASVPERLNWRIIPAEDRSFKPASGQRLIFTKSQHL